MLNDAADCLSRDVHILDMIEMKAALPDEDELLMAQRGAMKTEMPNWKQDESFVRKDYSGSWQMVRRNLDSRVFN